MKTDANVIVTEDNAGGLHLFVEIDSKVIYAACYTDGKQLHEDYKAAIANPAEAADWDEDFSTFENIAAYYGWEDFDTSDPCQLECARRAMMEGNHDATIAANGETYPDIMGCAGKIAFNIAD